MRFCEWSVRVVNILWLATRGNNFIGQIMCVFCACHVNYLELFQEGTTAIHQILCVICACHVNFDILQCRVEFRNFAPNCYGRLYWKARLGPIDTKPFYSLDKKEEFIYEDSTIGIPRSVVLIWHCPSSSWRHVDIIFMASCWHSDICRVVICGVAIRFVFVKDSSFLDCWLPSLSFASSVAFHDGWWSSY